MDKTTRYLLYTILGLICTFMVSALVYHIVTPKIVLNNPTALAYRSLTVKLPTNQLSFDPIPANSSQTIYFSPQKVSGDLHYILEDINGIQQEGTLAYSDQTEYFRRITAEIGQDNQIKVSMN